MPLDVRSILRAVLGEDALPRVGDHGVAHRARALEDGPRLAGETDANVEVARGAEEPGSHCRPQASQLFPGAAVAGRIASRRAGSTGVRPWATGSTGSP